MALQHLRSSTAHKRPIPTVMSAGQIAINTNEASPALFFKDSNGDLVKVGPVHIGTSAPNSSPDSVAATALVTGTVYQILTVGTSDFTLVGASANTVGTIFTATGTTTGTGTVSGQQGVEKGEMWLDTTGGTYVLKIYDGTDWRSESGTFVDVSGDTMTGDLVMNNANIVFEGATADDFETTLTVTDPTADRTITLPDTTGTVVTTGDTGSVTSTMILDGTIVNADVNASAAIAGTKIDPDFGSQTVETTGVFSAARGDGAEPSITFTGDLDTGIYSPGENQLALTTGGAGTVFFDASGNVSLGKLDSVSFPSGRGLQIFDGNTPRLRLANSDTGIGSSDGSFLSLINREFLIENKENANMRFYTNAIERVRITSDGKVGVGTSSPDALLHLAAPSGSHAYARIEGGFGGFGAFLDFKANSAGSGTDTAGALRFFMGSTTDIAGIEVKRTSSGSTYGTLALQTASNGTLSDRLFIDSAGNVGIGLTGPAGKLQILTGASGGNVLIDAEASSATNAKVVNESGDLTLGSRNATGDTLLVSNRDIYFKAGSSETEFARIDSSGRLLVGTSSQAGGSLLQVNDDRIRIASSKTPASASDTGTAGEVCWDSSYVYVCTATNTWKRAALSTW